MNVSDCEKCVNYGYDAQTDEYYCSAYMDEDDLAAGFHQNAPCVMFDPTDEYGIVRKQN